MRYLVAFFFLLFSLSNLSASKKELSPCFLKNSQSIYTLSHMTCLAVSETNLVCHDPREAIGSLPEGYRIIKYDPFTRIYEIESPDRLKPVAFKGLSRIASGTELALIEKKGYTLGKVLTYANGIDGFGLFSDKRTLGKVIGARCYTVVGFGSLDGRYIPSEFMQHFIKNKQVRYGDIGVRLEKKGERFVVAKRDLFFPENPFEPGDEILSINGKHFKRFDALTFTILFAEPGSLFKIGIQRDGKEKLVSVRSGERYGGGYLTDTFLERFGLIFDQNLVVRSIREGSYAERHGMIPGDHLLQFDGVPIETITELTTLLTQKRKRGSSILFEREDFQFFLTIY